MGALYWFGKALSKSVPAIYEKVAFVPEEHVHFRHWTGEETIAFVRSFYPAWSFQKESEIRDILQIPLNKSASTLSKGNRVRLSLLLAFSQGGSVLLLDEPFSGLDPLIREEILSVVSRELEGGALNLLMTSHDLFAVETLAQEIWLLHNGHFLYQGPLSAFLRNYFCLEVETDFIQAVTKGFPVFARAISSATSKRWQLVALKQDMESVCRELAEKGRIVGEKPASLQDAYAACVNANARNQAND
jgi:ABC-2 type transport system ATP-binding protein